MNDERLLKLANTLDRLPDKVFDFNHVMKKGDLPPKKALEHGGGCGTVGCAIGWSPLAFPRLLGWNADGRMFVRGDKEVINNWNFEGFATTFFDISYPEAMVLFAPSSFNSSSINVNGVEMTRLEGTATPKEVAANIRKFVAAKKLVIA